MMALQRSLFGSLAKTQPVFFMRAADWRPRRKAIHVDAAGCEATGRRHGWPADTRALPI